MKSPTRDNNTYDQKVMLRTTALSQLQETPVVMETHGGVGDVWSACYRDIEEGVVIEKRADRCVLLAHQRPSWSVYEADSIHAVANGAGSHLPINFLDVDPYGDSWPVVQGFFASQRPFPKQMIVVANCGLRQKIRAGGAWDSKTLEPAVRKFGNDLWNRYLEVCEFLMEEAAAVAGYEVSFFDGYYCGVELKMTHYLAVCRSKK